MLSLPPLSARSALCKYDHTPFHATKRIGFRRWRRHTQFDFALEGGVFDRFYPLALKASRSSGRVVTYAGHLFALIKCVSAMSRYLPILVPLHGRFLGGGGVLV